MLKCFLYYAAYINCHFLYTLQSSSGVYTASKKCDHISDDKLN